MTIDSTAEKLLAQAQQVCSKKGARLTKVREQVFLLLAKHQGAVGAYDLLEELQTIDAGAKPATIYRALDFLSKQGFVHKIESINAFIMCHHFGECNHPVQLLICDTCGQVDEIQSNNFDLALRAMADASGFTISHQIVEAHGSCRACVSTS
ncbi:zinc uptake transcriptional repressor Zur [Litorilituus lipolyticus]|uniref:Zinc uptake transcriptional repressor Zur n=1 Tax=Litorilituus lipolyticus TaxID=2491017 RepID=A0A502KWW6_9GAMM|nr:zinc uptake transcriptional repressor Zur [Litorilituus lipolyticus]TPH16122.1 zinc uptake transcriptional repressor Zur [Litorilituus lipolyticus]